MVEASADEVTPNLTEAQTVKVPKAPKTGDPLIEERINEGMVIRLIAPDIHLPLKQNYAK